MAGKIGINDQLISLDKIDVRNMEPSELAPHILGTVLFPTPGMCQIAVPIQSLMTTEIDLFLRHQL
jgi:hypothetical protein